MTAATNDSDRDEKLLGLLASRHLGVLATLRRDGRPQLSSVSYTYDRGTNLIRVSLTDGRAKTANIRRDPRVAFHVSSADGWSYVVADGVASLGDVALDPDDGAVEELIDVYRAVSGEHPDWADYRAAMVRDKRLVFTLPVSHVYGMVRS